MILPDAEWFTQQLEQVDSQIQTNDKTLSETPADGGNFHKVMMLERQNQECALITRWLRVKRRIAEGYYG